MNETRTAARWDREFGAGKYDFLHTPAETARLDEIAAMISRSIADGGSSEVVDIGCGEGLLLERLQHIDGVNCYVGVDISSVALSRPPEGAVPVSRVNAPLADWDGGPPPLSRRILVASEILYYDDNGVAKLVRIAGASDAIEEVIVSCVAGRHDKPNWTEASKKLWRELAQTGWEPIEEQHLRDERSGLGWDIVRFGV